MANSGSQKQISFDLRQESLKRYYPQNPTQAYHDIRRFMESHGFEHRQSSVYVSLDKLTTLDVVSLTEQLAVALPWLFLWRRPLRSRYVPDLFVQGKGYL